MAEFWIGSRRGLNQELASQRSIPDDPACEGAHLSVAGKTHEHVLDNPAAIPGRVEEEPEKDLGGATARRIALGLEDCSPTEGRIRGVNEHRFGEDRRRFARGGRREGDRAGYAPMVVVIPTRSPSRPSSSIRCTE